MKRTIQILGISVAGIALILLMTGYSRFSKGRPEVATAVAVAPVEKSELNLPQLVSAINLDRPFEFAGEPVPMNNFDVRERLDKELIVNTFRHSVTLVNIKSAHKYFPVIEPILRRNGVPDDFKYLAVAESDLQNVVSPAGARGIWQFMGAMADHYGLETNNEVDERYHIEKATEAACHYLLDTKKRFGTWTLTAAAYNMGATRLARELENQFVDSYYDLQLREEPSRYVFRLIAIKEIVKDPSSFGFNLRQKDLYPPMDRYKTVRVDGPVESLKRFAKEHGTTFRMLKLYNPWLITDKLSNPRRKTYEIKIPS